MTRKKQAIKIVETARTHDTKILIAYNRRFYSSVLEAEKIIQEDGGLVSVSFEFTEWSHIIAPLDKNEEVKKKWFLANSTHVVDLVFFLSGQPEKYSFFHSGGNDWHPSATIFSGSGITNKNILFNYGANWEAPGRWSVELITKQHRLYLKPMEELQIQQMGSVAVSKYEIDDSLDKLYKPGIYRMIEAYLNNDTTRFQDVFTQYQWLALYNEMANYQ